ncbi:MULTISPECIES: carbamoyltransferase HypF [Chromobacterium]|uniref:carbamoyltransferase HypF n=1 Tax=Chromobacterium TaxID=535 RepID=UPI001888CC73|nr:MULTISPECIES: carbamoyltransferase HypF [Chromobacterium]QOZ83367.1 carbamoyltransferase HypF [Chromobacterium sp. Rain0013]WON83475.1 carbamoyltransferase HypF [Chromobacterium haemolyticum]
MSQQRIHLSVQGRVQGVGFRPFIWRTASECGLTGFVRNSGEGVTLELQGEPQALSAFRQALRTRLPPLAHIDALQERDIPLRDAEQRFQIEESSGAVTHARLPADVATCPRCVEELFTPGDRRYRFPFINCTDCGPRYTVTHRLPYDRANTSMLAFPLCPVCRQEYLDPNSRRFHAEPTACPVCGPKLQLTDRFGQSLNGDPIVGAVQILNMGRSIAMKGLGGFHLVCDAASPAAVARLRRLKHRPGKPLAIMALNVESIRALCHVSEEEAAWLQRPERPIVLLNKKPEADQLLPDIAPGLSALGVMLPYTPLQWLLFHEALGRPPGTSWLRQPCSRLWVMSSANLSGEPIVTGNQEARERLNQVADVFLLHNRAIVTRCDDSVVSLERRRPLLFRRARGFVPDPVPLTLDGPPVLALGAYMKATATVLRGKDAFVSQYIGALNHPLTCEALQQAADHLLDLTGVAPQAVACDLETGTYSSMLAEHLSKQWEVPLIRVQHHHAHLGAVLAEHGVAEPALGLALDGYGLGHNNGAWGGEMMLVDGDSCERIGHISPLPLPGVGRSRLPPWKLAVALWQTLELGPLPPRLAAQPGAQQLEKQLSIRRDCQDSTSLGRWFGAVAGLTRQCGVETFESEAAQRLEAQAEPAEPLAGGWRTQANLLDLTPLARHLCQLDDDRAIASLWHATLAAALADWAIKAARTTGTRIVALAGGCCGNRQLMAQLLPRLEQAGLRPLTAEQLPPNDGGLSLGQAWVARQRLLRRS